MGYLKFVFVFLLELVKTNIIKSIFLIVSSIGFYFAGTFKDSVDVYNIVGEVKYKSTYIYIYEKISDNEIKYENIWSDKPLIVKDGNISMNSYNGLNILFWVLFSIPLIIVIIASFINDRDSGWEVEDSKSQGGIRFRILRLGLKLFLV